MITSEEKDKILAELDAWLSDADVRILFARPPHKIDPVDRWERYAAGKTLYILIAVGPEQVDLEHETRQLFKHARV